MVANIGGGRRSAVAVPARRAPAGARATSQISPAKATPAALPANSKLRQPIASTRKLSGAWPPIAPSMPIDMVRPLTRLKRSGGSQRLISIRVETKVTPVPAPSNRRPA